MQLPNMTSSDSGRQGAALRETLNLRGQPLFAVNVNDQHDLRAAVGAANEAQTPLILMVSARAIEYSGLATLVDLFRTQKATSRVPIWLELDHATDPCLMRDCIAAGFDIVMADFSAFPLAENVRRTREAVCIAHAAGVLVEGEVTAIPDGVAERCDAVFTSPVEAQCFATDTGVDLLAISVGNIHGFSRRKPPLDIGLIRSIANLVPVPLVLHGADYCDAEAISHAVRGGVKKVNIGPELREAYCLALRSAIEHCDWHAPDHRPVLTAARQAVQNAILKRLVSTA